MNKYRFIKLISISILFIVLEACNTEKSNEDRDSSSTEKNENLIENKGKVTYNNTIADLILQAPDGERLGKIGQKLTQIKASETLAASDSASNFYAYTQYFNNSEDEFVDIQYFHENEIVNRIVFDIFLNNENDVKLLYDELELIYTKKYGKPAKVNKEIAWKMKGGSVLKLNDVSVKLASGLQITLAK